MWVSLGGTYVGRMPAGGLLSCEMCDVGQKKTHLLIARWRGLA